MTKTFVYIQEMYSGTRVRKETRLYFSDIFRKNFLFQVKGPNRFRMILRSMDCEYEHLRKSTLFGFTNLL